MTFEELIDEIRAEKTRQMQMHSLTKWHDLKDDRDWLVILMEEIGEVTKEINKLYIGEPSIRTKRSLREELIHVIAVASAWWCEDE